MSWNSSHIQQRLNYPTCLKHHAAFQLAATPVLVFWVNTDKPTASNRALKSPCLYFWAFGFFPIPYSFFWQSRTGTWKRAISATMPYSYTSHMALRAKLWKVLQTKDYSKWQCLSSTDNFVCQSCMYFNINPDIKHVIVHCNLSCSITFFY